MKKINSFFMNFKLTKNDFFFLFINLLMYIILLILVNSKILINLIAFFSIIQMIISFIYLSKKSISIFSLAGLFIVFTYIFHFGHSYIYLIDSQYSFSISNIIKNDYKNAITALLFTFSLLPFIVYGMGHVNKFIKKRKSYYIPLNKDLYFIMGLLIILICFPIKLYIDVNKIILFFQGGYNLSYAFRLNGILTQIANFHFVGFILLILVFKDNKKISNIITLFLIVYQCITMLTGNRGIQLISIIFTLYIYYKFIRNPNKYDIIFLTIAIFFGMKFLSVMSMQRGDGFNTLSDLISMVFSFDTEILFSIFDEFGYTLQTLVLEFRNNINHTFGLTYIYSLFTVLPNIGSFLNDITYNACYVNALNYPQIGGSYIGELYFNFGYLSFFFSIILGFAIGLVSQKLEEYINNNKLLHTSIILMPCISILWWVRNYFKDMPREFIWGLIFFLALYKFSNMIINKFNICFFSKSKFLNLSKPLVSIIMGVYNTELSMLKKSIESVLNQTYSNFELIIVNDKSTNIDTLNYLNSLLCHKKIKILNNQENIGLTKSLNIAVDYSRGQYIARMDSDDVCERDRIAYQVDFLNNHPEIDVLGGSIQNIGNNHAITKLDKKNDQVAVGLLFRNDYIVHPTVMIRREKIINEKYDERFPKAQDYALWCKLIKSSKFYVDSRIVLQYRIHQNQATTAAKNTQVECSTKIRTNYASLLLCDEHDIELLNKLVVAELTNLSDLDYICSKILVQNKNKNIFKQKLLKNEICKYYCYQAIKLLFNEKQFLNIFHLRYKFFFLKIETIKFLYQCIKLRH